MGIGARVRLRREQFSTIEREGVRGRREYVSTIEREREKRVR